MVGSTSRSIIACPHGHVVLRMSMVLLVVVAVSVNVVFAQNCGYANRLCYSKWGYCDNTSVEMMEM